MKLATVCYLIDEENNRILLGRKKYGIAKGVLNGFGGKVEKGETVKNSIIREFNEETGLTISKPDLIGLLLFKRPSQTVYAYVYTVKCWVGNVQEGDEMAIEWHDIENIPVNEMWPEDKRWFNFVFEKSGFVVIFHYLENSNKAKSVDILDDQDIHEESHFDFS